MKTKIRIKTPKGEATKAQKNIRRFIFGMKKVKVETYVNKEDSEMFWDVEGSVRDILKINKNVVKFDVMVISIFDSKKVHKLRKRFLSEDDNITLTKMLLKQTKVDIIKEATAQELDEYNKSWWERMKEKFVKRDV